MNTEINKNEEVLELVVIDGNVKIKGAVLRKKRILIGRSENCDLVINVPTISAIHAVLEVTDKGGRIYDLNSMNGIYVNETKTISSELKIGDKIRFGDIVLELKRTLEDELVPPPLEILSVKKQSKKKLPLKKIESSKDELPVVEYPLAKDPKAEFSEYIFEDTDTVYPIFSYEIDQSAIEVILLYKDNIYSVDYLPKKNCLYNLVGVDRNTHDIEYPYLPARDRVPFVEVKDNDIFVHALDGYELLHLSDKKKKEIGGEEHNKAIIDLDLNDIITFKKGELTFYIRRTDAPPKVAHAPVMRRDKVFQGYLVLCFLMMLGFLIPLQLFEVDKEIEKEKLPERVATILYKPKLISAKKKAKSKSKKAPRKVRKIVKNKKKAPVEAKHVKKVKKANKKIAKKKPNVKKVTRRKTAKKVAASSSRKKYNPKNRKTKGRVDAYKAPDLKSALSSLLAKGGDLRGSKIENDTAGIVNNRHSMKGSDGKKIKMAKMNDDLGSLVKSAKGELESSTDAKGLTDKKTIFTAGIPSKTVVLGSMDPDLIREILRDHIPQFRYCYQRELDRTFKELGGAIILHFTIGASGHVVKAGATSRSSLNSAVKGCVINVLKGIKFPEPAGGGRVSVKQPINFYPKKG